MYQRPGLGRAPIDEVPTPRPVTNQVTATIPSMKPPTITTRTKSIATMPIVVKPVTVAKTLVSTVKQVAALKPPDNRPGWKFIGGKWTRPITDYKVTTPFGIAKTLTPVLKQIVPLTKTQTTPAVQKIVDRVSTVLQTKTGKPVVVTAPGIAKTITEVRSFLQKPTERPTNSAKPEVQIVTAATGQPAVQILNPPTTVTDTRPPTATITATDPTKPFIEFEKPLIQIQPKPPETTDQPAQAGVISEGAKTWIKYGLIATGAFLLWNVFSTSKPSPRLRRV